MATIIVDGASARGVTAMPDVRLIDANALLKELRKIEVLSLDGKDLFTGPARIAVFGRIGEAPTITPPAPEAPQELTKCPRGVRMGPDGLEYRPYRCPECGHEWLEDCDAADYPNYCPVCGCDMREKAERGSQQ